MNGTDSAEELVNYTVRLRDKLMRYATMDAWTPAMGAMLLAGIEPPLDCRALPPTGLVSLDGDPISRARSGHVGEAEKIIEQWDDWCEDQSLTVNTMAPAAFVEWCVKDEIKERFAIQHPFVWIDVFKDLFGYRNAQAHVPFEVALYADKLAQPVQVILNRLDEIDRGSASPTTGSVRGKAVAARTMSIGGGVNAEARGYLLNEEFAASLGVLPTTIHKSWTKNGHYGGVVPKKLPSGRLAWPLETAKTILNLGGGISQA